MTASTATSPVQRRLSSRTRKVVLTVHIAASVALLGSCASIVVTSLTAALTDDTELAHSAYQLLGNSPILGIPFTMLALISGVILSVRGRYGLFRYRWTSIKLVALVGVLLIGAIPQNLVLGGLVDSANPTGDPARWAVPALAAAQIALLLVSTALSVTKPSARLRRSAV